MHATFFYISSHKKSIKTATCYCLFQFCIYNLSTYFINECVPREISRKELYRVHVQTMVQK